MEAEGRGALCSAYAVHVSAQHPVARPYIQGDRLARTRNGKMEVFQDLTLKGPDNARKALRDALVERAKGLWRHAPDPSSLGKLGI